MAVTMTTKFYNGAEFRDLSKVVFTSPNIDSPNTAGTRSHILPGELDLGMWYEDTSHMYIVETDQHNYTSTYFGYSADLCEQVDLDDPPVAVGVYNTNQIDWLEFIRDAVGGTVGYDTIDVSALATITATSGINNPGAAFSAGQWTVPAETEDHRVLLYFSSTIRPTKVSFKSVSGYEAKYFDIKAAYAPGSSEITCATVSELDWTTLYDGTNQTDMLDYNTVTQTFTFSNVKPFSHLKFNFYSKWSASNGYSMSDCIVYDYDNDDSITTQIPIYVGQDKIIFAANAQPGTSDDVDVILDLDSGTQGTGTVASGTNVTTWGWPGSWTTISGVSTRVNEPDVNSTNSVVFELMIGEAYNCRLTAWDDITHSTTLNHLLSTDRCRVSCVAYNANGTALLPTENEGLSFIHPPALNKIFKGNTVHEGENHFYGDFDMIYRTGSVLGDYLIFKPMLYDIDDTVPYGIHDHVIVLHYSYT
jgi:hypothetical protein